MRYFLIGSLLCYCQSDFCRPLSASSSRASDSAWLFLWGNAKKNAIECLNASLKFSGLLSVDLISAAPTLTFMFSWERRRKAEKKNEGPCAMRFTLCATLFYKRLHQRPHTLYFLVGPGLAMIIPDMNSSTTISKLIFDITITISAFFLHYRLKMAFFSEWPS